MRQSATWPWASTATACSNRPRAVSTAATAAAGPAPPRAPDSRRCPGSAAPAQSAAPACARPASIRRQTGWPPSWPGAPAGRFRPGCPPSWGLGKLIVVQQLAAQRGQPPSLGKTQQGHAAAGFGHQIRQPPGVLGVALARPGQPAVIAARQPVGAGLAQHIVLQRLAQRGGLGARRRQSRRPGCRRRPAANPAPPGAGCPGGLRLPARPAPRGGAPPGRAAPGRPGRRPARARRHTANSGASRAAASGAAPARRAASGGRENSLW